MKFLCNRRLFVTRRVYIGLGPSNTLIDNTVVLLFGGDVPFVPQAKNDDAGHYKLLGECYVHGIMNGEVFKRHT